MTAGVSRRWIEQSAGARTGSFFMLLTGIAVIAGCAATAPPLTADVRTAIEKRNPGCRLERDSRVSLAGLKLALVKGLARASGESEGAEILSAIRRVEVETYRVATPSSCADASWMEGLAEGMVPLGWWPMAVERDGPDATWVFAHGGGEGDLDGLFVIDLGRAELEVVRLDGRIDRVMAEAVAEHPEEARLFLE